MPQKQDQWILTLSENQVYRLHLVKHHKHPVGGKQEIH